MYILGNFWDKIGSAILESLRSLMMSLCEVIYKLIIFFFDIFIMLGNGSLLTDETLLEFYERIGLLIGLFMTFRVIFSLIQYVINPDMMIDKSKGLFNIIKRIIFVVVLLGTTPYIFKLAFNVQNMIIDSNIIPKVITGKNIDSSQSGETLAWYAFSSFFDYDEEAALLTGKNLQTGCPYLNTGAMENNFKEDGNLLYAYNCVNVTETYLDVQGNESKVFIMRFDGHGIIPVIVGVVILWMILMYTIQVGVRVVQLAYLQLIAPAPIIMYLTPKGDETFNKWVKQCTTTYIDFFIRVAIMWFVIFIVDLLTGEDFQHFIDSIGAPSGLQLTWITIVMIIALLIFAQKIPKLFNELFPMSSGAAGFSFGLNAKKEVLDPLKAAYNSPLGWAPKALGWAGRKTIGAIDRKVHNLPKPRNKVQQYFDKLAPGHAEVVKQRNQAKIDAKQWEANGIKGKELFDSVGGDLAYPEGHERAGQVKDNFFKNQAYVNSWNAKAAAKGKVKSSEELINNLNNYITDTQNDSTLSQEQKRERINNARIQLKNAHKNLSAAQGELKIAQERHEKNQKIYTKDAEKERLFNDYADTHKGTKTVNVDSLPGYGQENNSSSNNTVAEQNSNIESTLTEKSSSPSKNVENGVKAEDIYVSEKDIEEAYEKLYDLTGSGASSEEVNEQLNWINEIKEENNRNLEAAYAKLYDLTGSGASQEEIDNQIKIINDIKSGEINRD